MFDTAFSRNFSLLESQWEFVRRFRAQADSKQALPVLTSACPGMLMLRTDVNSWTWVTGVLGEGLVSRHCLRVTCSHFSSQRGDHRDT